jgi:hypothetical protein
LAFTAAHRAHDVGARAKRLQFVSDYRLTGGSGDDSIDGGNDLLNAVFDGSYTDTVNGEAELMKAISTGSDTNSLTISNT